MKEITVTIKNQDGTMNPVKYDVLVSFTTPNNKDYAVIAKKEYEQIAKKQTDKGTKTVAYTGAADETPIPNTRMVYICEVVAENNVVALSAVSGGSNELKEIAAGPLREIASYIKNTSGNATLTMCQLKNIDFNGNIVLKGSTNFALSDDNFNVLSSGYSTFENVNKEETKEPVVEALDKPFVGKELEESLASQVEEIEKEDKAMAENSAPAIEPISFGATVSTETPAAEPISFGPAVSTEAPANESFSFGPAVNKEAPAADPFSFGSTESTEASVAAPAAETTVTDSVPNYFDNYKPVDQLQNNNTVVRPVAPENFGPQIPDNGDMVEITNDEVESESFSKVLDDVKTIVEELRELKIENAELKKENAELKAQLNVKNMSL